MSTSEKLTAKDVAAELNKAHSPADLNKALTDSIALRNDSSQSQWKDNLATINAGVQMDKLGLKGFTIADIGADKNGNKLIDVVSKDGKQERLISADGAQHGFSADGKNIIDLKKNILTDASAAPATPAPAAPPEAPAAPAAPAAEKTVAFGNRNRQMTVSADGKDAVYTTHKGDNLWSVAKDYLQQQGKTGSAKEIANLAQTIASENKIQDANHIGINQQIHIKPLEATAAPTPPPATPPEVAPAAPSAPAARPGAPAEVAPAAPAAPPAAPAEVAVVPPAAPPTAPAEVAPAAPAAPPTSDAAAQPQHSFMDTVKEDAGIAAKFVTRLANEGASPFISGMGAKMFMEKYGVKLLEAGFKEGNGRVKLVSGLALGALSAVGISEGVNATSVALGNESLSQTRILTNGLAGYTGMKVNSAIEGRFANSGKFLKGVGSLTGGSAEWSIYDLGGTNPFVKNDDTGKNYTVGETAAAVKHDFAFNAGLGVLGHGLGYGARVAGRNIYGAGVGTWNLTKKIFTRPAATEAETAYHSIVAAH